jgi:hypothetical protein
MPSGRFGPGRPGPFHSPRSFNGRPGIAAFSPSDSNDVLATAPAGDPSTRKQKSKKKKAAPSKRKQP